MSPDLAAIIVTWNVRALALDALRTLTADLETTGLNAQVWVVDNASADGTPGAIRAEFPQVRLIESDTNLGFGAGNNAALRALGFCDSPTPNPDGPRAVFLLNPDTLVQPGAVGALHAALFGLPRAGVVGARLSYEDGAFQHSAFRFPGLMQIAFDLLPMPDRVRGRFYDTRLNGRYSRALYAKGQPFPVDHTLGATMMLRREAIEQTGLFDEQFYMYVEEIDWSMRIRRAGWEIYTVPAAHIIHLEGRSTKQARPESLVNLWRSRFRFYTKHYPPAKVALARLLVGLGMRLKIMRGRQSGDPLIEAYRAVMGL